MFIVHKKLSKKEDIDLVCYSSRMRMRMERLRHVERECFYWWRTNVRKSEKECCIYM